MPREGHDINTFLTGGVYLISIHVPREGHDAGDITAPIAFFAISIHVPREGHDDEDMKEYVAYA